MSVTECELGSCFRTWCFKAPSTLWSTVRHRWAREAVESLETRGVDSGEDCSKERIPSGELCSLFPQEPTVACCFGSGASNLPQL